MFKASLHYYETEIIWPPNKEPLSQAVFQEWTRRFVSPGGKAARKRNSGPWSRAVFKDCLAFQPRKETSLLGANRQTSESAMPPDGGCTRQPILFLEVLCVRSEAELTQLRLLMSHSDVTWLLDLSRSTRRSFSAEQPWELSCSALTNSHPFIF